MNFLPLAILAYILNGFSSIIDKVLLKKSLPSPLVYTFYINILGILALFLIPLGLNLNWVVLIYSIFSGLFYVFAMLTFFQSVKDNDLTVVAPVVGSLHPVFALILGGAFLHQYLSTLHLLAFFVLLLGTAILTYNLWSKRLGFNKVLMMMVVSGMFFALSSVTIREAFLLSNFITPLVVSRVASAIFVLAFLIFPVTRKQVFHSNITKHNFLNKTSALVFLGQSLGATGGVLLVLAVFLESPAIVNALFGMQYLVILGVAIFTFKKYPDLLGEKLSKGILFQKILGAAILSIGVFMLSK